ncbi:MAG: hypothetical protein OQJ84_09550 [Xanthomonadales bacterium]|nr:hypothetical protein [Xanthomonadales bacterium]
MSRDALNILVLHEQIGPDARADELDTLAQAEQVAAVLRQSGDQVVTMPAGLDLDTTLASIAKLGPDCVFNLVESLGGDGRMIHIVPALLSTAEIPFTGSSGEAIFLSSQKQLAKQWMRLNRISTPACLTEGAPGHDGIDRWIVKSRWEHASFGMDDNCVVSGTAAAQARIELCAGRHGGEWFAEQFVDGREFNVSILEVDGQPRVLPIAEIGFVGFPPGKPKIVGYAAKWDVDAPEYHATPREFPILNAGLSNALTQLARKCWKSFGLRGYARVDFRLDAQGTPWVLEVNANPCLSRDAGFAAAAHGADFTYEQLIGLIVEAALPGNAPAAQWN